MNWKDRVSNKVFWLTLLPALAVLFQALAVPFGYTIDLTELVGQLTAIVNAIFVVLAILGIVVDPQTKGIKDK